MNKEVFKIITEIFGESRLSAINEIKYENDKGELVPKKCPKCGSDVKVFFKGEPVFLCSNSDCNKYFGTIPCKS